jgi:hypothetical protein
MQRVDLRLIFTKFLLICWAAACIYVFIKYSASRSILQGSSFDTWPSLGEKVQSIDGLTYCLDMLKSLLGLLLFCAGCMGTGSIVLRALRPLSGKPTGTGLSTAAALGTALVVGQGVFSVVFLTLAEIGQLKPFYVGVTVAASLGAGLYAIQGYLPRMAEAARPASSEDRDRDRRMILGLAVGVGILSLMFSSARLSYDSVALYFSDAKLTALSQSLRYFLDDSFVVSSFHTGIQYAAMIQLFGDQSARMYSWANGILIILFGLALAEELGLSGKGLLALLAMMLTTTAMIDMVGDGKIDLASTAPALAAVYWMAASRRRPSGSLQVLSGFLMGQAMADRPFNFVLLPMVLLLFQAQICFRGAAHTPRVLRRSLRALILPGLGTLPWLAYHLASNWFILGDPLAFLQNYGRLSASTWQWAVSPNDLWFFRMFYPFTVSFLNTPQSLGTISPLFVAFLPLVFLHTVRRRIPASQEFGYLMFAAAATLAVWIVATYMVFEIRYVFFLWVILFMPVAAAIGGVLEDDTPFLGTFARVALVFLFAFTAVRTAYVALDSYAPINRQGNPQCGDFEFCDLLRPVNQIAAPGARVLTLNAFRYYLRTDLFSCSTTHTEYSTLQQLSRTDVPAFWREVYREGYLFIVYEKNYSERHLYLTMAPGPGNAPAWLSLEPIFSDPDGREVAYLIHATNPPIEADEQCVAAEGIWTVQGPDRTAK